MLLPFLPERIMPIPPICKPGNSSPSRNQDRAAGKLEQEIRRESAERNTNTDAALESAYNKVDRYRGERHSLLASHAPHSVAHPASLK